MKPNANLACLRETCERRLDAFFADYLAAIPDATLKQALATSLQNKGKQLRPLLVYSVGSVFNASFASLDIAAAAVELIHTYSLIHDDLPCMDNADMRRGQPTSHKLFGEGMAVLAGDALLTLAFEIISKHAESLSAEKRLAMINALAHASGAYGMIAGQAQDIASMQSYAISADDLLQTYALKTGCLFTACMQIGCLASENANEQDKNAMIKFGDHIGIAFQIQDDLLDITSHKDEIGKDHGLDDLNNKPSYPRIVGIKAAIEKVEHHYQQALAAIHYLGARAELLREVAIWMLKRQK